MTEDPPKMVPEDALYEWHSEKLRASRRVKAEARTIRPRDVSQITLDGVPNPHDRVLEERRRKHAIELAEDRASR